MELESLDSAIRAIARRHGAPSQLDDLEQIGRIKAWQVLEQNATATRAYILKSVENQMRQQWTYEHRKKRHPDALVSLDEPDTRTGRTLSETVGKSDAPQLFLGKQLIALVREHLGNNYVRRIQQEPEPTEIVRGLFRALIDDVARIPPKDIVNTVNYEFFRKHNFDRLLWVFYQNSPVRATIDAYNGEFLPWDFRRLPRGFLKGRKGMQNARAALRAFVQQRRITEAEQCRGLHMKDFGRFEPMVNALFNGSPYAALRTVFPELKPWQTAVTPKGYFSKPQHQRRALTDYLVTNGCEPLRYLNAEETYEQGLRTFVSRASLEAHGLSGLIAQHRKSPYQLFKTNYAKQMLPWTLHGCKEVWKDEPRETAANAIRWLFDTYLQVPMREIPYYASNWLFWRVGFSGILTNRTIGFNSSTYAAMNTAYPGTFTPADFAQWRPTARPALKDMRRER